MLRHRIRNRIRDEAKLEEDDFSDVSSDGDAQDQHYILSDDEDEEVDEIEKKSSSDEEWEYTDDLHLLMREDLSPENALLSKDKTIEYTQQPLNARSPRPNHPNIVSGWFYLRVVFLQCIFSLYPFFHIQNFLI